MYRGACFPPVGIVLMWVWMCVCQQIPSLAVEYKQVTQTDTLETVRPSSAVTPQASIKGLSYLR